MHPLDLKKPQRHKGREEAIAYYLAKDKEPLKAKLHRGLRKMINTLNKCCKILSLTRL